MTFVSLINLKGREGQPHRPFDHRACRFLGRGRSEPAARLNADPTPVMTGQGLIPNRAKSYYRECSGVSIVAGKSGLFAFNNDHGALTAS